MERPRRDTLAALAGGLAVFALAVLAARATLPEWRAGELPRPERFLEPFQEVAESAGVELAGDGETLVLARGVEGGPENPYAVLGAAAPAWLLAEERPLLVRAAAAGTTAEGLPVHLSVYLGLDGRPWTVAVARASLIDIFTPRWDLALPTREAVLLRPGERLGKPTDGLYSGNAARLYPVLGTGGPAEPPQFVAVSALDKAPAVLLARSVGEVPAVHSTGLGSWWPRALGKLAANILLFTGVVVLAFVLALRRRIDFVNAALLALLATLASVIAVVGAGALVAMEWLGYLLVAGLNAVLLFVLWATAESLLRDSVDEAINPLDLLRRGRIDRRVARAALWGLGGGAAVAAVVLLAHALGATDAGLAEAFRPERASLRLPPFEPGRTPFDHGIRLAGEVLLVLALALRLLPRRWVFPAALAFATAIRLAGSHAFSSMAAELLVTLLVVALLLAVFRRAGSAAVLVASVAAFLWPVAAFAAAHPSWLGGSLAGAGLSLAALGVVGVVGFGRADLEARAVEAPAFLARLEEERRVRYEMDLLARMQLGLLPDQVPQVPGWQVAARSMLAHEVGGDFYDFLDDAEGRLWIAAGDVAGHGSFCSISHAMAKAALASLVTAERTPAEVLIETDRVLRRLGARRIFTSLSLLRLDPRSGRALLANAGYPFPLIRGNGDGAVREIELPGLPLGQGPARTYGDVALELAPGEALVLSSDGLFEARGRDGRPYGFDRYRAGLAEVPAGSAGELLEQLLRHWRDTIGGGPLEDDTTVVVVRRDA